MTGIIVLSSLPVYKRILLVRCLVPPSDDIRRHIAPGNPDLIPALIHSLPESGELYRQRMYAFRRCLYAEADALSKSL